MNIREYINEKIDYFTIRIVKNKINLKSLECCNNCEYGYHIGDDNMLCKNETVVKLVYDEIEEKKMKIDSNNKYDKNAVKTNETLVCKFYEPE